MNEGAPDPADGSDRSDRPDHPDSPRGPYVPDLPRGWTRLPAERLPAPTFWPAGLALAITFVFWGLVSSPVILIVGLGLLAVSLGGWINHMRHERRRLK